MGDVIHIVAPAVVNKAVALYAILVHDVCDFIDMVQEEQMPALNMLLAMLEQPNSKHNPDTVAINATGADIVRKRILVLSEQHERA